MKRQCSRRWGKVLVGVLLFSIVMAGAPVFAAFHASPLRCSNCHTMHNSYAGATMATGTVYGQGAYRKLLKVNGCMGCHDGTRLADGAPNELAKPLINSSFIPATFKGAPWVQGTYPELPSGGYYFTILVAKGGAGDGTAATQFGHMTVDEGAGAWFPTDAVNGKTPPGGGQAALTTFACASCHDPHATPSSTNVFRLLRKKPDGRGAGAIVSGLKANLVSGGVAQTVNDSNMNAYQSGMETFCAACHGSGTWDSTTNSAGGIHNTATAGYYLKHPTAKTMTATSTTDMDTGAAWNYVASYNRGAGGAAGGHPGTWYDLPLEDAAFTGTTTATQTVTVSSKVFCLSCHKAHSWVNDRAVRWDMRDSAGGGAGVANDANVTRNCNSCHQKG